MSTGLDRQHRLDAERHRQPGRAQPGPEPAAPVPGRRTRVEPSLDAQPLELGDYRVLALREVLAALDHAPELREATLAAADRDIARRALPVLRPSAPPHDGAEGGAAGGAAMWRVAERRAVTLYRHARDGEESAPDAPVVEAALARIGSGAPLSTRVRRQMEAALGVSLARVRVHTDATAAAAARAVHAEAFTVGEDIFFGEGAFCPDSPAGQRLIVHELVHVLQSWQGRTDHHGPGLRVSQPTDSLEQEAEAIADATSRRTGGSPSASARARREHEPARGVAAPSGRTVQRARSRVSGIRKLRGRTLLELDRHARRQADWASWLQLRADGDEDQHGGVAALRRLLGFARAENGLLLAGLGRFLVKDLLRLGFDNTEQTRAIRHYCQGVREAIEERGNTVAIIAPAPDLDTAIRWGAALVELHQAIPGPILRTILPQRPRREVLCRLVESDMVHRFIQYVSLVRPTLDAADGREIECILELLGELSGPELTELGGYRRLRPYVRNLHRFERRCLDALRARLSHGASELPLCIVMLSGFDHSGASYRNRHLTELVLRPGFQTFIIEDQPTLAELLELAKGLAGKLRRDGRIEEVLLNGHGEAREMELAGRKRESTDERESTESLRFMRLDERLREALELRPLSSRVVFNICLEESELQDRSPLSEGVDAAWDRLCDAMDEDPSLRERLRSTFDFPLISEALRDNHLSEETVIFISGLAALMSHSDGARIVLSACSTAAASVEEPLVQDPMMASKQILDAIRCRPSLAAQLELLIHAQWPHVSVRGTNGYIDATLTRLHDSDDEDRLDLILARDPHVTSPDKAEYVRRGVDPSGVMRALLETWATKPRQTLKQVRRRLRQNQADTSWDETVIRALFQIVKTAPEDAERINTLRRLADVLTDLTARDRADIERVKQAFAPLSISDRIEIYQTLQRSHAARSWWISLVILQLLGGVYGTAGAPKLIPILLDRLERSIELCGTAVGFERLLDLELLGQLAAALFADESTAPRARFVIAAILMRTPGLRSAGHCKHYLRALVDQQSGRFPDHLSRCLGDSEDELLAAIGGYTSAVKKAHRNVRVGRKYNDVRVSSVTLVGISDEEVYFYAAPDAEHESGRLPPGREVHVIGTIGDWWALEWGADGLFTVFVRRAALQVREYRVQDAPATGGARERAPGRDKGKEIDEGTSFS